MDTHQQQVVETFLFTQGPSVNLHVELDPDVVTSALPAGDGPALLPFDKQIVGGCQPYGVLLPDFNYHCGDYQLAWQLELLGASVLHLGEFSVSTGSLHTASIELPAPALPQVVFSAEGDHVFGFVVLRNGVVLTIPFLRPSISGRKASGLKTLHSESISQCSLHEYRTALVSPNSVALVSHCLCIAGKGSSILCVPLEYCRGRHSTARPFELREASWGLKPILHGVLYKSEHAGYSGLFSLTFGTTVDFEVLGSVRQDGKFHLWDLQKRSQVPIEFPTEQQHNISKEAVCQSLACRWLQLSRTESLCFVQHHSGGVSFQTECYRVKFEAGKFEAASMQAPPHLQQLLLDAAIVRKRQSYQVWTLTATTEGEGGLGEFAQESQLLGYNLAGGQLVGKAVMAEAWLQRCLPACTNSLDRDFETMFCSAHGSNPKDCLLPLLLGPGVLSRTALCEALSMFGARLTPNEVQTAPLSYLESCVEAALLSIAQHNPGTSLNQAWGTFSSTYLQCWRRCHSVLRMVTLMDGSLLLVRAGLLVSLLRPAERAEITSLAPPFGQEGWEVMRLLQQLMGSHLLGIAAAQLLAGVDARVKLVPVLVQMLLTGPVPVLTQPHSDRAASEQREWRKVRRQLLLMLNSAAESTVGTIRANAEALISNGAQEDTPMTGSTASLSLEDAGKLPLSPLTANLASSGAALVGWSQCAASLQLLVLAGLLDELKLLSPALMDAHSTATEMLMWQLQSATLTMWLSTHPASPGVKKEDTTEAMEVLSRLQLSPVLPGRPTPLRPASSCTLAAVLLPLICKQAPHLKEGISQLPQATAALVAYLQQGVPGQYSHTSVSQFLKAGYILFQAREVNCLEQLVRLAGENAQRSAGLLFLQGLGLTCQVRQASSSSRSQIMTRATTLFFQAASSFRSDEGGDLREMLSDLRRELVARGDEEVGNVEALLQLQLYEVVMLLFEREGAPDGAILFAQAAVEHLPAAYEDPTSEVATKHAGRLWSHIFSCSCELKDYDGAYMAALSNPVPRDSVECLKLLVHCCCDDEQYLKLCSLPFAGTATVERGGGTAKKAQLAFVQEAMDIVHKRARHADISSEPSPYLLLYSFLTSRSQHRKAAAVMLEYAERLMQEYTGVNCVNKALTAYGCAIGSLELVEPASAWLQSSVQRIEGGDATKPLPVLLLEDLRREFARLSAASTVALHAMSTTAAVAHPTPLVENAKDRSADELFQQLLALQLYDAALALAHSTWKGATLAGMIQRVVCALATLCVHCPDVQQEEDAMFPDSTSWAAGAGRSRRGFSEGGAADVRRAGGVPNVTAAWHNLQSIVQVYYGDRELRSQLGLHGLGIAVADAVLVADRRMVLPPWLMDMLKAADSGQGMAGPAADSASLLIVYLKHERLLEATDLVISHFTALATSDPRTREQHCATWMPHNIIATLHKRLSAQVERARSGGQSSKTSADEYEAALSRLVAALRQHVDLVERHSHQLLAYGKPVVV